MAHTLAKSLIAKEVDENGNIVLDEINGMKKKDAVSAAFSSMDFKVENPLKELSQFSFKDNQARVIDEVKKKVEEYAEALGDAEAAYRKMAETAKLEGNEDKKKEYEAQADALKEQADAIDGISEKAEKLAKQNALKETLDAWCDGIERFTDQALSIFSNINTLLDNIADGELQKMERQKESAIENLDEQLEQGLISQEEYEESKKTLEDEYNEKEKEDFSSIEDISTQNAQLIMMRTGWNAIDYANAVADFIMTCRTDGLTHDSESSLFNHFRNWVGRRYKHGERPLAPGNAMQRPMPKNQNDIALETNVVNIPIPTKVAR